ncbi:MAG TPA: response regulator [Spirochaetia bacterium]|nr:response regulator [Spirochaetia bacterium]
MESNGKTILVVDDSIQNLKLFKAILSRGGFAVLTVENGDEAITAARRATPALVLMDLTLPGTDGLEVTRRFKADPDLASIPVVAVTAWARTEDRERALEAGCADFLAKPVSSKDLVSVARRLTGVTGSDTPPHAGP